MRGTVAPFLVSYDTGLNEFTFINGVLFSNLTKQFV